MAINKVIYGTTVLVDLTEDTVTQETLLEGVTAHNAKGELITGTAQMGGGGSISATDDGVGNVTITMNGATASYSNGNLTIE